MLSILNVNLGAADSLEYLDRNRGTDKGGDSKLKIVSYWKHCLHKRL